MELSTADLRYIGLLLLLLHLVCSGAADVRKAIAGRTGSARLEGAGGAVIYGFFVWIAWDVIR